MKEAEGEAVEEVTVKAVAGWAGVGGATRPRVGNGGACYSCFGFN